MPRLLKKVADRFRAVKSGSKAVRPRSYPRLQPDSAPWDRPEGLSGAWYSAFSTSLSQPAAGTLPAAPRLLLIALAAAVLAAAATPPAIDPATLVRELHGIEQNLDRGAPIPAVPPAWLVRTPQRDYSISTEPLRTAGREQARAWVDHLASELEPSPAPVPRARARGELQRILARPEFAGVGPPSLWELLRQRLSAWILSILDRLFTFVAQHSTTGKVFFWVLVAAIVGLTGLWLIRFWSRDENLAAIPRAGLAPRPQTIDEWIHAAREAAERGDLRTAIQCAFWAAVVRLQETGALPRGRTHTAREYLGLLAASQPGRAAAAPQLVNAFRTLTVSLERFWYGRRSAAAGDFRNCLQSLEALGCRVE